MSDQIWSDEELYMCSIRLRIHFCQTRVSLLHYQRFPHYCFEIRGVLVYY
jgi:hypothetical protein